MFDLLSASVPVSRHYARVFASYDKPDAVRRFILGWLSALDGYAKRDGFVAFEPELPLLDRLVPDACSLLIVSMVNPPRTPPGTSVIPLFPFRVNYCINNSTYCCDVGKRFIKLYLSLTGLRIVGLYDLQYCERSLIGEMQNWFPDLTVYETDQFHMFARTCEVISNTDEE